jgi:hypothetical protein
MKRLLLVLVVLAALAAGLILAFKEMSAEREREARREKPVSAPPRVQRAPGGESVVTLEASTQKRMALQTAPLAAATLDREVKAFGRVLDPASLVALASEIDLAQTALAASRNEFERVKKLLEQNQNASVRAVETAQAAMSRDQIALDAAHDKLVLAWGRKMAEQPDLPAFARGLAARENLLVRLELPAGEALKDVPPSARLQSLAGEAPSVEASFFSLPTAADPQSQGQGFVFLTKGNPLRLSPGATVLGWLKAPGQPVSGVIVPRAAVVRALGQAWVYVQTGDDTFVRRPIALEQSADSGWFVKGGLQPGERVVTAAAQALWSEEMKAQIKLVD